MTVELSQAEKQILEGRQGKAAALAMQIIVRMAEIAGAPGLIEISQAHIDACTMLTHSGLKFMELLTEKGGRWLGSRRSSPRSAPRRWPRSERSTGPRTVPR